MGRKAEQRALLAVPAEHVDADRESPEYELRRQVALLPEGTDRVDGSITPALWEGRAAEAADDALASSGRRIRQAAEDLEAIAAELEDEADDGDVA